MQPTTYAFFLLLGLLVVACGPPQSPDSDAAEAPVDSALRAAVVREVESLNAMRSRRAWTVANAEDVDTALFAQICQPVKKHA